MTITELQKSIATGLSMPRPLKERIDTDREDVSRSKFILSILEKSYGNEQESGLATTTTHPSPDKSRTAVKRYKHDNKKKQERKVIKTAQVGTHVGTATTKIADELRLRRDSNEDKRSNAKTDEHISNVKDDCDLSDGESKCNRYDIVTGVFNNEYQEDDKKIFNFNNTDDIFSDHTVTEVTPIIREEEASLAAEQKSDEKNALYASYFREDRYKAYTGLPKLKCLFCESYSPIKFDMDLHLYKDHRENLFTDLPIKKKKGFTMDNRINYVLAQIESEALRSNRYFA